ncbi:hypothetical protein KIN20_001539 [Parelaphostrongylus tenuis]|uniref:Uncharacterized protein n=1 Tax=Parelaphostrongylus tenuis TaxID=148309 RepID=A0AAD5QEL9_PARTN|nr:hypothetical protein KIN20_001539 [Parelaphostrongylus tenuis]
MREQLFLRILRTRAIGRLMEEVVIPLGQTLGYRCSVSGCRSDRSFSMISIIEHMKGHYAQIKDSKCHYNYQCKECERYFVLLGMTASCYCKRLNGTESNCLVTREDWSSSAARENVGFFNYVQAARSSCVLHERLQRK